MYYIKRIAYYIIFKLLILWGLINIPFEHQLSKFINNSCKQCFGKNVTFTFLMDNDRNIHLYDFKYKSKDLDISWNYAFFSYDLLSMIKLKFTKIHINHSTLKYHDNIHIFNIMPFYFDNIMIDSLNINDQYFFKNLNAKHNKFSSYYNMDNTEYKKITGTYILDFDYIKVKYDKDNSKILLLNKKNLKIKNLHGLINS